MTSSTIGAQRCWQHDSAGSVRLPEEYLSLGDHSKAAIGGHLKTGQRNKAQNRSDDGRHTLRRVNVLSEEGKLRIPAKPNADTGGKANGIPG
jgi:hypothetical protein